MERAADNLTEPPGLARAAISEPTRRKRRQEPPPQTGRQMPSGSDEHQRQPCNGREAPNGSLTAPLPALLGVWAGVTVPGPWRALSASASGENGGQSWELAVDSWPGPCFREQKGERLSPWAPACTSLLCPNLGSLCTQSSWVSGCGTMWSSEPQSPTWCPGVTPMRG